MRVTTVSVKNFRLLSDVELALEDDATVIVGRNNSGKTSLSEVLRRLLRDGAAKLQLEDFSTLCYERFWEALGTLRTTGDESAVRKTMPRIEARLTCTYDKTSSDLGPLAPFIIDVNPDCTSTVVIVRYELNDGAIKSFFEGQPDAPLPAEPPAHFFKVLRDKIPQHYSITVAAQDPNDPENYISLEPGQLRTLIKTSFITAQRGLDDVTTKDTDVLAAILERLFSKATLPTADAGDKLIAESLSEAVAKIQLEIDQGFATQLQSLMPALERFGYPGIGGQKLQTETTLEVSRLLSNFTKVRYSTHDGVAFPESYNGLGVRNLIYILLQIVSFYKEYCSDSARAGVHLVFIEEPEAHLHPQMQEVFIRKIADVAVSLVDQSVGKEPWNVQFVVSTHSSHIANAAGFESIRYFMTAQAPSKHGTARHTKIKDLRRGLSGTSDSDRTFLHQYLTLTRCDLFFADKAAVVEGLSERLIVPVIVQKLESAKLIRHQLSSEYVTILEVGGAYAHIFFSLLDFLELPTLVVTDIDSITRETREACDVHLGDTTSNACIKQWFAGNAPVTILNLLNAPESARIRGNRRIAYQCPEVSDGPCGRSFEDAFLLANRKKFGLEATTLETAESEARAKAIRQDKAEFALRYAINDTEWSAPKYLVDGLLWLADGAGPPGTEQSPTDTKAS